MDKQQIKQMAQSLGLDCIGVCGVEAQPELEQRLRTAGAGAAAFANADMAARTQPAQYLPGARSIIVALFPYDMGGDEAGANLARYARVPDYHRVAASLLGQLGDRIAQYVPGFRYAAYADTGPLVDRHLAYLAGLGFWGLNHCLINERYGSWFTIGYMLTNMTLAADVPLGGTCAGCGRCVAACPGGALGTDGTFEATRCVSWLTQQKHVTEGEKALLTRHPYVFGCDVCQEVCPHNQGAVRSRLPAFQNSRIARLDAAEVCAMSNRAFRERYGGYAFAWRGKSVFQKYAEPEDGSVQ